MPRLVAVLALCLLLAAAPARAMDAQKVFAKAKGSVVVVVSLDGFNKPDKVGSGFVVGDGTQILTNFHVVEGASGVRIKTPEGTLGKVKVVDTDSIQDLALLKLDGSGPPLDFATELPKVGQEVAAIGSPKGFLEQTLSTGIVSAVRTLEGREVVQITAPVSHGSSGGPVLDAAGKVVGVATFVFADGQNLNFAIPCTTVLRFLGRPVVQRKSFEPAPEQRLQIEKSKDGAITIIQKRTRQ